MSSSSSPELPRKKRRMTIDGYSEPDPPDSQDEDYIPEIPDVPPFDLRYPSAFSRASNLLRSSIMYDDDVPFVNNDSDSSGKEFQPKVQPRKKHRHSRSWRDSKLGASSSSKTSCASEIPSTSKTQSEIPGTSKSSKSKGSRKSSKFSSSGIMNKISQYFKPNAESSTDKPSTSTFCSGLKEESVTSKESNVERVKRAFLKGTTNYYGLFGEDFDEDKPCYFDRLPIHVMETILCQIPIRDLLQYRTVCSSWNNIIKEESFMKWKKMYYGYKMKREDALEYLQEICISHDLLNVEECFKVLIMVMSEEFGTKPSADMYECLSQCQNAVIAELVLAERFPDVLTKESKSWCILATAIWLSEKVSDVLHLYEKLTALKSDCSLHDVTNALYCIAAFLLHFTLAYKINQGMHYRLYSALYWIENTLPKKDDEGLQKMKAASSKLPGQQSLHMYCEPSQSHLTFEQLRILNHQFQQNHVLKIVALAGTGKTTTLVHLAQLYPQVKFLNVMFNKAVCEAARTRFPPNVTCKTAHSLAYATYGRKLMSKMSTKIRPPDIVNELQHFRGAQMSIHCFAKNVLTTLENFVSSADKELSVNLVPSSISDSDKSKVLKDALQIWEKMIDKNNKTLRITHDVYLKLYQLSCPKLDEYQCLMIDEAQDCNPTMVDIMMSQKLPVILVGDPNQQIYGFRGAKNALQGIQATHTYYLTKSFRFGPEISYIASCCLSVLKEFNMQTLVGSDKPSHVNGTVDGQYAVIARTNIQLFNEAIRICYHKRRRPNEPSFVSGAFAGGLRSYGYDQMLDMLKLQNHSVGPLPSLKDKFLAKFKSFKDLHNYARSVEDNELMTKLEIVNQHGSIIPHYINILKKNCNYPIHSANVVFSTAHKAKGLEFDTVCLTDDYPIMTGFESTILGSACDDEVNIMYVALTRAKRSLLMPDKLLRALLTAQEKFEYPVSAKKALGTRETLDCVNCSQRFTPHTVLVMKRRRIVTAYGRTIPGGILCVKCATEPFVRPRVQIEPVVMYLDPAPDLAHRSMASLVGPLPSDPPIRRDSFGPLNEMDVVYIINVNL